MLRILSVCCAFVLLAPPVSAQVRRATFTAGNHYLVVEVLTDSLVHFEISAAGPPPADTVAIHTSPMVVRADYPGPSSFSRKGTAIDTRDVRVVVEPATLCVATTDKVRNRVLTRICPVDLDKDWKGLSMTREQTKAVYGLGQQFKQLGSADGDWLQHGVREEQPDSQPQEHGNGFMVFWGGMVGNIQFPILYALGDGNFNYALFLDNVYKQRWDFTADPWQIRMWGDQLRFYVLAGPDLPALRARYMDLVGRPPVPPRKAFGLWVSEFGYKNWRQIDTLRQGLRRDRFPVDGFVLDLQWFGGIVAESPDSRMGALDWDQDPNDGNGLLFSNPDANIGFFAKDHVGLVTIEESYVSQNTRTFADMRSAGPLFAYLPVAGACDPASGQPAILSDWFGKAAMIDWSNPDARAWVHENRRLPNLVSKGILGHWTDLGEPEKYDRNACYHGVETTAAGPKNRHGDIHNLYAFLWNGSIYDGYARHNASIDRRPFMLTRSGAPGSPRFGTAFWSGDIASRLDVLATHMNAQLHMSFSGVDFFGSDVGGFRREAMPYNANHVGNLQYQDELYTQWLANAAWFDVPIRPHTDNSFQQSIRYETAPDLVGVRASNLANLRQRYELTPYYYSLAYRAHLYGEPLVPPVVFYYQNDPMVTTIGHEKLIGRDVLVGVVASHGELARNVYLPAGRWVNYHTRDWFDSSGQWIDNFPTYVDGVFRLPAFARAGAILPAMQVDDQTKDVFGHRLDAAPADDLIVQVFADPARSTFTLYEDDGATLKFDAAERPVYATRTTDLSQQRSGASEVVTIAAAQGTYPGAAVQRNNVVRLVVDDMRASGASVNGGALPGIDSMQAWAAADRGWINAERNLVLVKSGVADVTAAKKFEVALVPAGATVTANFVCDSAWTALGEEIFVTGSGDTLGNWDPARGVHLSPSVYYAYIYNPPPNHNGPGPTTPKWTGVVRGLPSGATIEWKCARRTNAGQWQFEPGANHQLKLPARGFAGTARGNFGGNEPGIEN